MRTKWHPPPNSRKPSYRDQNKATIRFSLSVPFRNSHSPKACPDAFCARRERALRHSLIVVIGAHIFRMIRFGCRELCNLNIDGMNMCALRFGHSDGLIQLENRHFLVDCTQIGCPLICHADDMQIYAFRDTFFWDVHPFHVVEPIVMTEWRGDSDGGINVRMALENW